MSTCGPLVEFGILMCRLPYPSVLRILRELLCDPHLIFELHDHNYVLQAQRLIQKMKSTLGRISPNNMRE